MVTKQRKDAIFILVVPALLHVFLLRESLFDAHIIMTVIIIIIIMPLSSESMMLMMRSVAI